MGWFDASPPTIRGSRFDMFASIVRARLFVNPALDQKAVRQSTLARAQDAWLSLSREVEIQAPQRGKRLAAAS